MQFSYSDASGDDAGTMASWCVVGYDEAKLEVRSKIDVSDILRLRMR